MANRPELRGSFGMVSSTHYLATAAGMAVLESGGNAVDAVVATGFALQVVEPHLNGPGGDMTLLFAGPEGPPTVLCGQGPAPAGATMDHYLGLGLDLIPGSGPLAAAVPGSTAAWLTLLRDHGTATLRQVLDHAIGHAAGGIPVLPSIHRVIAGVRELFEGQWPTSAEVYLPGGTTPQAWEWFSNPALAATYRRLLDEAERAGPGRERQIDAALRAWSQGFVAEAIDAFAPTPLMDSSGAAHPGVITGGDLAGWTPSYEPPVTAGFGDWTVAKSGPWGQGPVLLQQLRLLSALGWAPGDRIDEVDRVHVITEVAKLAFADREAWYGDSAPVPMERLLSDRYTAARAALVGESASLELRPGSPAGMPPRLATSYPRPPDTTRAPDVNTSIGEPTVSRTGSSSGDTCHVSVVDRHGNTVAATPSGGWLQSSPVIPGLGFCLGSRLQMMSLEPGLPTSLIPGRRPRTTLSPSMAMRAGVVELAFGTPGGDQQDQWQLGFLLRYLLAPNAERNLQAAVDGPAFHSTHFPSSFFPREAFPGQLVIEDRFAPATLAELERRGHEVLVSGPWSLGRLCAVARDPATGRLRAAADPRSDQAYAAGR